VNPMSSKAKQLVAEIIGDGKLFDEGRRAARKSNYQRPEKRPGPFAQDRSRTPPTKQQRDNDYKREKEFVGKTAKRRP
jgi:hypothetical protein